MGLGRNKWHFLSFIGTQLSANHVPSGPHTTPLASCFLTDPCILPSFHYVGATVKIIRACGGQEMFLRWKNVSGKHL